MITKNNHMDLRIVYLFRINTTIFVTSGKCKGLSYSAILELIVYVSGRNVIVIND